MEINLKGKSYLPTETEVTDDHTYFFYLSKTTSILIDQFEKNKFSYSFIRGSFKTYEEFKQAYFVSPYVIISRYTTFDNMIEELNESLNTKNTTA